VASEVVNAHHSRALRLFATVIVIDQVLGVAFALASHIYVPDGMYWAVVTVTTVGYGDITPHGWMAHLVSVAVMILAIPLWTGAFGLITAGFVADHVDRRHSKIMERL